MQAMRVTMMAAALCAAVPLWAELARIGDVAVEVDEMANRLNEPWSIGFLPGGAFLVTERGGRLWRYDGAGRQAVSGVPKVFANGQGGLFDAIPARDFDSSGEVFLSYAKDLGSGRAGTVLAVARLEGASLTDLREIFVMETDSTGGRHFGGRIVEGPEGHLFLTIGERGDRPAAQDLGRHNGTVIRVNRDGLVPADNPFVRQAGVLPEIWSYGHRNPQGAALDAAGQLWVNEHGARGGDEVNRVQAGANYGWPVISYGRHYSGMAIGEGTEKAGMEQPAHYWDPSIAPSGMAIYSGRLWPDWAGDFFVGSLKFDYIARLDGESLEPLEGLDGPWTGRVRDVREAPDGTLWFLSVQAGAVYRISPAE
ncbi:PQQ-dependent sugar dehydrogenase [Mesobacterium pallidum]|uniref:PQQ-dependent sugar dehydrogenase n=1 Tax=Mesobacterium pallidum TaxID=2872037 RepID=UPI001EE156C9|nr:PQQ-dependent sugar dehydrogenase [Mesobacterium pallidum]